MLLYEPLLESAGVALLVPPPLFGSLLPDWQPITVNPQAAIADVASTLKSFRIVNPRMIASRRTALARASTAVADVSPANPKPGRRFV